MHPLPFFVYGTLKSGFSNHFRYCQGASSIEKAWLWGRLYDMGWGYPLLEIPAQHLLPQPDTAPDQILAGPFSQPGQGDWDRITGELIHFPDPQTRLPQLDRLEGFDGSPASLYLRVVTPVLAERHQHPTPAWCYIVGPQTLTPTAQRIPSWPTT